MKRLIVCCDGTWNDLEMPYPTNVVKIATVIRPTDNNDVQQILYYDEGVGTGTGLDKINGGAFGKGIDKNIQDAYLFLCLNYQLGDEVYLFGFSRGAYTVRSLAGLIGTAGLLYRKDLRKITQAYQLYRSSHAENEDAIAFREHNLGVIDITLLACWDTVGALGIPNKLSWLPFDDWINHKYKFHNTTLGGHVINAIHAVAIDEYRQEFAPTLMEKNVTASNQRLCQQWFCGDHGSIGGGSRAKQGLSNISLRWMTQLINEWQLGLDINLSLITEGVTADCRVYFNNQPANIYGIKSRSIKCQPDELHQSVINRWQDCKWYRPANLKQAHGQYLEQAPRKDTHFYPIVDSPVTLKPDEKAAFVVFANNPHNDTLINLIVNGHYRIQVAATHVWQDGHLDACDALGWSLNDATVNDQSVDFGFKKMWLKKLEKKRVHAEGRWFELTGTIDNGPPFRIGDGSLLPNATLEASQNGRLYACANDVSSSIDFIDKYDNNQGWLIVEIERLN